MAVAYLTNWVGGRCDVAERMTIAPGSSDVDPCGLAVRAWRDVGTPAAVSPPETAQKEQCVPSEIDFDAGPAQGFSGPGWQPWNLCFTQTAAGWRVIDWGQG